MSCPSGPPSDSSLARDVSHFFCSSFLLESTGNFTQTIHLCDFPWVKLNFKSNKLVCLMEEISRQESIQSSSKEVAITAKATSTFEEKPPALCWNNRKGILRQNPTDLRLRLMKIKILMKWESLSWKSSQTQNTKSNTSVARELSSVIHMIISFAMYKRQDEW